jgi:aminopeptidase N
VASEAQKMSDTTPTRSSNLARTVAEERFVAVTVKNYKIDLDLTDGKGNPGTGTFRSTTTVSFGAKPGTETFIDLAPGKADGSGLVSATLNGVDIAVDNYQETQGLTLPDLQEDNTLVVNARCAYSGDGQGLHRFKDLADDEVYLHSQFEVADAKRVFACFDQPDLKATFDITVTAPPNWDVISNAVAQTEKQGYAKVHQFATTPKISTYLVALIAGPFSSWHDKFKDKYAEISLGIYCRKSLAKFMDAGELFDLTKRGFAFFHEKFDIAYPFGKYDQVFCAEFNVSGMENVAAITYRDDFVFRGRVTRAVRARRAEVVFHEMSHMWFGDLVTMKWWDDLWLNESFASWAANFCLAEAGGFDEAWTTFANVEKAKAYRQDQYPTTHAVAGEVKNLSAVFANFDPITYIKGASTLKQLVAYMGIDNFLHGLRDYFNKFANDNARLEDLLTALQGHAGGRDLEAWAKQWLRTTGLNTLRAQFDSDNGQYSRLLVTQTGAEPGNGRVRPHAVKVGIYDDNRFNKLVRVHQSTALHLTDEDTDVPDLQNVSRGKLILVNDDDLTYGSQGLDPDSLEVARTRIADIAEPLARAQVWSALWEMTRDGRFKARDFVSLVTANLHAESEVAVAQNLLLHVQWALTYFTDPVWAREHGWFAVADRLLELAGARPGSDYQLAYLQALTADRDKERQRSSVMAPRHTAVLEALLFTGDPAEVGLPRLEVDDELRWRIVIALATAGVDNADAFIDAEYERDKSSAGALYANQAKAARPTAEAKAEAWNRLTGTEELRNADARAIAAGFAAPGQADVLGPYTERFFDTIVDVWSSRSESLATTIAQGTYPLWDVSADAVAAADGLLDDITDREKLSGLQRKIREGQADVKRSLQAREADTAE